MFDTADDPLPIPQCCCCPRALQGANYSRLACTHCEERMYDQLNTVASLWGRLPDATHRPVGNREPGRSMSVHPGMPGNGNIINLTGPGDDTPAGRLLAVEDDWRSARAEVPREATGRPDATLRSAVKYLRDRLGWACGPHLNPPLLSDGSPLLPDVQKLSEALNKTVTQLSAAASGEFQPRSMTVRCFARWEDGTECGAELRLPAPYLRAVCPGCGAVWTRGAFVDVAERANQFGAAA